MGNLDYYKPVMAMLGLQFTYAGLFLLSRTALLEGMSPRVFVVYRQAIAALLIAPVAYFTRRGKAKLSLGMKSFCLIFFTTLIGVTINQNLYFEGLYLASTSMASDMSNLVPAITFIAAAFLGGPKLLNSHFLPPKSLLLGGGGGEGSAAGDEDYWLLGTLLLFGSNCCASLWLILQGMIGSAFSYFVQAWCISRRGPLFAAMFNPLGTVITTFFAAILLHEEIYTGRRVGAAASPPTPPSPAIHSLL
ncbi:hypothetical protein RHSIM_Rhsim01G0012700 [Rhododendron simsii]|uniref:WAT1-related protein n=1 Tax=Rhododendron simsii TaxID=118357 RepID=A0A834HJR2_RHOSS|nr:hypothetical protein RHSIM_Rhsim01G0012700 [Rhododendron simsii]